MEYIRKGKIIAITGAFKFAMTEIVNCEDLYLNLSSITFPGCLLFAKKRVVGITLADIPQKGILWQSLRGVRWLLTRGLGIQSFPIPDIGLFIYEVSLTSPFSEIIPNRCILYGVRDSQALFRIAASDFAMF